LQIDTDSNLVFESFRQDRRPQVILRATPEDGCAVVAGSGALISALGLSDEAALADWFEAQGGLKMLADHAASRKTLGCELGDNNSIFLSVREQSPGVYQVRGTKVGPADVSNSLTAGIIANITNEQTGILFLDPEGRVLAVNESFYRFFPRAENYPQIGKSFGSLLHDSIRLGYLPDANGREDRFVAGTLAHFTSDMPPPLMVLTANGRWANTSRLRFSNGAIAILMIDVTEGEQEIDQYRSFVQNTRNMIYCRGDESAKFGKVWGQDALRMAGIAESDGRIDTRDWLDAVHPDDLPDYLAAAQERIRSGNSYRINYRIIHPVTGETRNMLENGWVTVDRASGERYLDSYLIDLTVHKQTEARLKASELRFREFAELAGDWYFEADENLCITYLSDGFEAISGLSPDLFMGVSWKKITRNAIAGLAEEHHQAWNTLLNAWTKGEPLRDHRMHFKFSSGVETPISTTASPILNGDGRHVGYRGVAKDVSVLTRAQKQAEAEQLRAETASRAKSEFIANMSHELRTPLNAIIGFAGVMEQQMFGAIEVPRYREYAGDISASGQHLLSLVNDILDLSRIEADRHSHDPEWMDLESEILRVCALFREEAGDRAIQAMSHPAGARIHADRRALRQILINLVGNAVKFSPNGGIIQISGIADDQGVKIRVVDTGAGMSEADIETALVPFGRAASPEIAGGTGLGLPISRKLTEMHGGELTIDSVPSQGCCVAVSFPNPDLKAGSGADLDSQLSA
jgi:two-component system cell cycle sensor histidine kinase PleC